MLSIMFNDATADIHFDIGVVYLVKIRTTKSPDKKKKMPQPLGTLFPAIGLGNKDH